MSQRDARVAATAQVERQAVSSVRRGTGPAVLVLERDVATVNMIRAALRAEGYRVQQATALGSAKQHLHVGKFAVILVDVTLDEQMDAALAEVRALAPAARIVVLTDYGSLDSALDAVHAGADEYLLKPIEVRALRLTVARAVERGRLEHELAARVAEREIAQREAQDVARQLRQRVTQATQELQRKVAALDEANRQLRETQAQNDRFVAMVAHEMRGTLNPVVNYALLAKRAQLPEGAHDRYMDYIVEHAYRLDRLIADLQTATRLSTGHFSVRPERVDVAAALVEVIEQFEQSVRGRQFRLTGVQLPVFAEVDRDRVLQAVRNLIDNAVKYSSEHSAIEIGLHGEKDTVQISVGDYGAGIPEAEKHHIFDAFTRLGHSTEVAGSGLGLFITRGIAAAHGGTLSVANRSGDGRVGGAIFTLTLPVASAGEGSSPA